MTPTITAFAHSPDGGRGLARDMRVRWALEEAGQPYSVRYLSFADLKEPGYYAQHPFGQIPSYEEGDLVLFESGAIVLHIAQQHAQLLPEDPNARARGIAWMFAALNSIEPPIWEWTMATVLESDQSWYEQRQHILQERVRARLEQFSRRLGQADWIEDQFSVSDLLVITVLRILKESTLLAEYPNLSAYVARGEARPAFKRAFAAQFAAFTGQVPAD
ncbi:MAG: glutathione S-transferase family protein [Advenella sp.]|uniref:glutathione S-transferase family protein n=1 Tax=unclassified Advenella TaxID=2685285 RepID=UPI0018685004|nr:glutathione S-transferase family protein [Advenella sp. FME57]